MPIHEAAHEGNVGATLTLLSKGADPNAGLFRWTPLHAAARHGRTDFVGDGLRQKRLAVLEVLLRHGADPTVRDVRDATPLGIAAKSGNAEAVRRLLDVDPSESAMLLRRGHYNPDVQALLENRSPPRQRAVFAIGKKSAPRKKMVGLSY